MLQNPQFFTPLFSPQFAPWLIKDGGTPALQPSATSVVPRRFVSRYGKIYIKLYIVLWSPAVSLHTYSPLVHLPFAPPGQAIRGCYTKYERYNPLAASPLFLKGFPMTREIHAPTGTQIRVKK